MKLFVTLCCALCSISSGFVAHRNVDVTSARNTQLHSQPVEQSRRDALSAFGIAILAPLVATEKANALDMDAFMNAELESDAKNCDPKRDPKCIPKLNQDEALCKYGQTGNARQEACKRVKEQGKELPSVSKAKSLGGAYAM